MSAHLPVFAAAAALALAISPCSAQANDAPASPPGVAFSSLPRTTQDWVMRWMTSLENSQPNYAGMTPHLVQVSRDQWPRIDRHIHSLGPLKGVSYAGRTGANVDHYLVSFQKGDLAVSLTRVTPAGQIDSLRIRDTYQTDEIGVQAMRVDGMLVFH